MGLYGAFAPAEDLGDLLHRELIHESQCEYLALPFREFSQKGIHRAPEILSGQRFHGIALVHAGRFLQRRVLLVRETGEKRAQAASPVEIPHAIQGDAEYPGLEPIGLAKAAHLPEGLQKNILQDVLRLEPRLDPVIDHAKQIPLQQLHQPGKGRMVAASGRLHP